MSAAKKFIKHAVCVIAALAVFFAAAPAACSFAADAAERWENEMAGAAFAAQAGFDGRGVRVAVIDSGAAPLGALPGLAASADYTGQGDAADSVGHGTFIAGIIAGSDAESGYRGAAPGAEIVSLKCFNSDNAGVSAAAAAIRDAVDVYGCRVINLSFGQKADDEELRQAVEHALENGAVIFAAAGNGGSEELYYPAAYDGVIAVNSVDRVGATARDAQKNRCVDIAGPAVGVTCLSPDGLLLKRSGSSYAVPFAAAAAAVLLSAEPGLTAEEVQALLCDNALDAGEEGRDDVYGFGILDIEASLKALIDERPWLYSDVPGGCWYDSASRFAAERDLLPGDVPGRFDPFGTVSRAVFVTALYRLAGSPEVTVPAAFTDVPADSGYADAVAWAAAKGLVNGVSATEFAPDAPLRREAIATVLCRGGYSAAGADGSQTLESFSDCETVPGWAREGMEYCVREGLLKGTSGNRLDPKGLLNRAALAVILQRISEGL